jgi:hypothetical protein
MDMKLLKANFLEKYNKLRLGNKFKLWKKVFRKNMIFR